MQNEKNLKIHEKALGYVTEIYKFSANMPFDEKYNLTSQIRRAAVSIPLNISEGAASNTKKEFAQSLSYAYRSAKEVLTCLEVIKRLGIAKPAANKIRELEEEGEGLCKMVYQLRKKLVSSN